MPGKPGKPAAAGPTGSRHSHPSAEERALFRAATQGTRPLAAPPAPAVKRPTPRARFARADAAQVLTESLQLSPDDLLIETGDELLFRRATVAEQLLKRLRRGEFSVRDEIDLHGLTATEARAALQEFLAAARQHGHRCVRVIHGKGLRSGPRGPVLKHAVNTWLRKIDAVLAFASARQMDGGTGAVYVLLDR